MNRMTKCFGVSQEICLRAWSSSFWLCFTQAPPLSLLLFIQPARVSLSKPADSGVFVFVSRPQVETFIVTGSEYFCLFPSVSPLVFFVHQKLNKGDYEGREWKGKKEEGEGKCNLYLAIVSE